MTLDQIRALCADAEAKSTDLGCSPRLMRKLLAVADAAAALGLECDHPVLDEDGDGVWAEQVVLDCGECVSCGLIGALAALEASP